jgi:YD repeat-containing protein
MATVSGSGFCQTSATPDHPVCGTGYTLYNFYYRFGVPPDKIIINEIYATACDPSGCPAVYPEQDSASGQCLAECPQGDTLCMARNLGAPSCNTGNLTVGNPCNIGSGNKYQAENDLEGTHGVLDYTRHYNSLSTRALGIGKRWSTRYTAAIVDLGTSVQVIRGDGYAEYFDCSVTPCLGETDTRIRLTSDAAGYTLVDQHDTVEHYGVAGELLSITDIRGNTQALAYDAAGRLEGVDTSTGDYITFGHDGSGRVASMTDQAGRVWGYRYDAAGNLEYVDNPDGTLRRYHYNESQYAGASLPHALTGITDERGNRYATYEYDAGGRAIATWHAGNAGRVDIQYSDLDGARSITNSRGFTSAYSTSVQLGKSLATGMTGPGCATCGTSNTAHDFDPVNNYLRSKTENSITTKYGNYDSHGNYLCKVEGVTAADTSTGECDFDPVASPNARRSDYTYDSRYYSKIATMTEPSVFAGAIKRTTYEYDDSGNRLSETISGFTPSGTPVSRTIGYQYNGPYQQLSRIDGSRVDVSDITTLRYYADDPLEGANRARLKEVEDALGVLLRHSITYTPTGKISTQRDASDVLTTYDYYPGNDRLKRIQIFGNEFTHATEWSYEATGEVRSITLAHGDVDTATLAFTYDDARRLIRITDGLGNYIHYTLDTEGNREGEQIYDSNGTLRKALAQSYDEYNRLASSWSGSNPQAPLETFAPSYAPNGTLDVSADGRNVTSGYSYDDLKRLLSSTQDLGGLGAITRYEYDAADRLTEVIDPNNGTTTYHYDDLGNRLETVSPDTGVTAYTYDSSGNLQTRTTASATAEAVMLSYDYDALNRLTYMTTPDPLEDIAYTWDACRNGTRRLCQVTNGSSAVSYAYDSFGNVTAHQGVAYTHDRANRVKTMTYLSGTVLTYHYDSAGQVSAVDLAFNGQTQALATGITYAPFGGIEGLIYGNGKVLTQQWDMAYRLLSQSTPGVLSLDYTDYDGNGNLRQRDDSTSLPVVTNDYTYDALNRLDTASGVFGSNWGYDYDPNGNRIESNEAAPVTLEYETSSNRLDAIGSEDVILDVAGNTLVKGSWSYTYTPLNRLRSANDGTEVSIFSTE